MTHPSYRPDIDGLRAIAVLSVVGFHAFGIQAGFIGVDIFFVISGFLITRILMQAFESNSFSLTQFYAHRVKRILPALLLVIIATYAMGWFIMLPEDFKSLGYHITSSLGFFQNVTLWMESGYFDASSETKPLLHLWSLAIEEQFYLVYPFVLWILVRLRLPVLGALLIASALSFGLNVDWISSNPSSTFFLPFTRLWELLVGGALAYLSLKSYGGKLLAFARSTLPGCAGAMLIVGACVLLDKNKHFPGWWAAAPVVGAVLIIFSDPASWFNRRVLSSRPLVYIGLITYPLYLWHWPLLTFARLAESQTPPWQTRVLAVLLSVFLAWVTYVVIERPVRFRAPSKPAVAVLLLLSLCFAGVGYYTYHVGGVPSRMEERNAFGEYFENVAPDLKFSEKDGLIEAYREECNFYDLQAWRDRKPSELPKPSISPSCYTPTSDKIVMLWGDSHAQHLNFGLRQLLPTDISILQVATSGCDPTLNEASKFPYCSRSNEVAARVVKEAKPQVLILAQHSGMNRNKALDKIIKFAHAEGVKEIIVVGPVPQWTTSLHKIIMQQLWIHTPQRSFRFLEKGLFEDDRSLKQELSGRNGVAYASMLDLFCNVDGCLTYFGDDRQSGLVTHDYGHFPKQTSLYAAKMLLAPLVLKEFPEIKSKTGQ